MAKSEDELSVYDQPTLGKKKVQIKKGSERAFVTESAAREVWLERGWTRVEDKKSEGHKVEPTKENAS